MLARYGREIPKEVRAAAGLLEQAGFEACLVGGCVRDILRGEEPKDWDLATNAKPEEVRKVFPESVYENEFGTVGVKTDSEDARLKIIEITTFRVEGRYTDKRHPDEIRFAKTIEEDLSRRDFTINALALSVVEGMAGGLIDPYGGVLDIEKKIIRTVGNPNERFQEDALRLMRAVRLSVELGFEIEKETRASIAQNSGLLEMIAKERIRDEFQKMITTPRAAEGILLLEELGLLRFVLPELREGVGVDQNLHHIYTVFEHCIRALAYAAKQNYSLEVRLAALLHDIGKPKTKGGEGRNATFYNHEYVSAKMVARALDRLRFSKESVGHIEHLVRYHMFYYNVDEVSPAGVRRFLARVGAEYVGDLLKVREADRIGSGTPKAVPYKLRHLLFMIEKVKSDPIGPKMLNVNGEDVMRILGIPPGPKVGQMLDILLEEVLDEPKNNIKENLEQRIRKLGKLSDAELRKLREKAKEKKDEFEKGVEQEMKGKYHIAQ